MGTDRYRADTLRERRGNPRAAFDGLAERGHPDTIVEVCREGIKKCREILPALAVLLHSAAESKAGQVEPDDLPGEEMVGPVPGWVLDMHVREGNADFGSSGRRFQ